MRGKCCSNPMRRSSFTTSTHSVLVEFKSIAEFSPMSRCLFASTQTVHQTHNSDIEFKSDTEARAISSMEDWHVQAPEWGKPSKTMHGYGFYQMKPGELINGVWVIRIA